MIAAIAGRLGRIGGTRAGAATFTAPMRAYAVVGVLMGAVFFVLPRGFFQETVYYPLFGVGSAAAIVAGVVRHRPRHRLPWLLFAAGQLLFALGDTMFGVYDHVLHESPFPSAADGLYLPAYPV